MSERSSRLSICFVTEDFYPGFIGGQGIYGHHLVSELTRLGVDVTVIAEQKKGRKRFWSRTPITLLLVPFVFGNQLLLALSEYLLFRLRLGDERFDVLHANQLSGLFFVFFRPKNVGKIIVSVHNTYWELRSLDKRWWKRGVYSLLCGLEKILYRRAETVLFHSDVERERIVNAYEVDRERTGVVNMGWETRQMRAGERRQSREWLKKQFGIKGDEKVVLCVARLVKRKRVDLVLEAVGILRNRREHVFGVIVGGGPERTALKKRFPHHIVWAGTREDLTRFYLGSDVFVLMSEGEGGLSLAAMEAVGYGLPVVVSEEITGGAVRDGVNGFVSRRRDPQEMADLIERAFEKGHVKTPPKRGWRDVARETFQFYEQRGSER